MSSTDVPDGEHNPEYKKYESYSVTVDPNQDDKATEIKLLNFSRPHMRAFHCSWFGFFMAFFIWFAITPLLSEIKDTLELSKEEVWTSSIVGVGGTIAMRFILGPLCDKFGAKIIMAGVLCVASIPCALTGLVNSAGGLAVLRLFIGIAGGSFVACQFWSSRMFTKEVVGTANALCGGWGNLGGGVTQIIMGSVLFPLFKVIFADSEDPAEMAWRTICVVPALVGFGSGVMIYFISDDAPKGNYSDLKKYGAMPAVSAATSFSTGATNVNTWLLFIQYATCFGVELTMNNAAALYFREEFGESTETAAMIASIFGWMNLFARGLGGYLSDHANKKLGMRGRIIVQTILLLAEGVMVIIFANTASLGLAIFIMIVFSIFVQAAEGSTYGIVPYVDPPSTGSISGIVGAGGNTGAVCFGLGFRNLPYKDAFIVMGVSIIVSAIMSPFIFIRGQSSLFCGEDKSVAEKSGTDSTTVAGSNNEDSCEDDIEC